MKEPEIQEWACRLLEDQLMRLAELRNANPRDSGFKLWRQTSLTVIQRVWPGNLQRSERFRRIPFTPNTPRPSRAQVREHFERGCGEATAYLRELISEIQQSGLDPNQTIPAVETVVPPESGNVAERLAAPLPGERERPTAGEIEKAAPLPKGDAPPPIPGFLSSSDAAAPGAVPAAPPPPPVSTPVLHKASSPAAAPRATSPSPPAPEPKRAGTGRAKSPRKTERRALKEMLGFVEEQAAPPGPPPISKESERPGISFQEPGHSTPVGAPPSFDPAPPVLKSAAPVFEPAPPAVEAVRSTPPEIHEPVNEELLEAESDAEDVEPTMGEDPEEMLRSAAWASTPKATPAPAAAVAGLAQSPVAATLIALASQVADLGVPDGKRAATRAALTDLARQLEDRTADWDTLCDAFQLAMKYPPMARRVIPLLIPFLDLE